MSILFNEHTKDSVGAKASDYHKRIGETYLHSKNHRLYMVTGVVWNGDTDTWMIEHMKVNSTQTFVRSIENFCGNLVTGEKRFIKIVKD